VWAAARAGELDDHVLMDRTMMHPHFYWDDVPAEVIAADDLTNTVSPGICGLSSIIPFIASDHAGRITCPVFIGLGERDSTCDHHREPLAYFSSNDITFFLLPGSAHCHNTATTRLQLWERLGGWIEHL
jgi:pimeloyl-ACP methyl ester carboxylesterase